MSHEVNLFTIPHWQNVIYSVTFLVYNPAEDRDFDFSDHGKVEDHYSLLCAISNLIIMHTYIM